jgi:hypothetical protein
LRPFIRGGIVRKAGILMLPVAVCLMLLVGSPAAAQSAASKFEAGPTFSFLKLKYRFRGREALRRTADNYWFGIGGRVAYNLTNSVALEAEVQKFDSGVTGPLTFDASANPDVQGLFGVKAGLRRPKFGVFAKLRPGFTRFSPVFDCPPSDTVIRDCNVIRHTGFSADGGSVVEGYLSSRLIIRGDVGAVWLRRRETNLFFPGEPGIRPFNFTSQGFNQLSLSFGVGFTFRF